MKNTKILTAVAIVILVGGLSLGGCARDDDLLATSPAAPAMEGLVTSETSTDWAEPPPGLVDVDWQTESLRFWPYTGNDFSGATQDPINLIFVGKVDPVAIRAALMSVDGDRTAFGFPDEYPFNATWTDAVGNVQTGYAEDGDWTGAVVQLALGNYQPIRFHLRLIDCGRAFGTEGCWTLGAAHFEITIPGTADHQVLSWERAEEMVALDLVRSGLVDLAASPVETGVINQTGSYHEIPPVIYNGVPDPIKLYCGLPPGPTAGPVGIPTDGKATVLFVTESVPIEPGTRTQNITMSYDQMVPKPLCSSGPADYVYLNGDVNIEKTVRVDASGRYQYASSISGRLTAIPMDVTQNPPAPAGEPYSALVGDEQRGILDGSFSRVKFDSKRIAPGNRGTEMLMVELHVASSGENLFRTRMQCLGKK